MSEIRPSLKSIHSPDFDLDSFVPEEDDCFGFLLQAFFGPVNSPGEESFDIFVCTPSWLERNLAEESVVSGRHYLFMKRHDLRVLRAYLNKCAQQCDGATWSEVALKLGRFGKWEFEDYKA